jgi:hypothetical protein
LEEAAVSNPKGIGTSEVMLRGPAVLACGAFVSPRVKSAVCQECYGRHHCRCGKGTSMPCDGGQHFTPGSKRAHWSGRQNRGFVDINSGRDGMSTR